MNKPSATPTLEAADIALIMKALPHRYPFLMVDRIINIRGDEFAIGIKNVTINEPQFLGHFPGNPVFPGVLLIEGMAQTAGAVCVFPQTRGDTPKQVYFLTIDKAKFRKPVIPGDTIEYHMTKLTRRRTCGGIAARRRSRARWSRKPKSAPCLRDMKRWRRIDPTARVAAGAVSAMASSIGPYCVVGSNVALADGCRLVAQVHLEGHTSIGARTVIYPFASLGTPPQSVHYRGGPTGS